MENSLLLLGRLAGVLGTLVCVVAIALRLFGLFWIGGLSLAAVLQGGMALVVIGCFALLLARTTR